MPSLQMMDESARLLVLQQQLEKDADGKIPFFGLSVNETIRTLLLNSMSKKADKLKSDFKVPEKRWESTVTLSFRKDLHPRLPRFWHVKLQALTALGDWEGLEAFSKSKRSPIGYEVFVHHLVEKGHQREAVPYVARCDAQKRVDLYVECGEWRMAGKECKERGDKAKIE
jgi:vacuolar protein sorting-associated protein 16